MVRPRRIASVAALILAALAALVLLPLDRWTLALVGWMRDLGAGGVAAYALVYVVATVLMLPGSAITLVAGFVYGPLWGTVLVSPVSVAAAVAAFLLGRSIARGWVERRVARNPRFAAVDRAVGRSGVKIVLLLRLSPVFPFNLLNYALAVTRIRLRDYVVASFVGMLPGTLLYVYLGSLITSASQILGGERPDAGPWGRALYWGGLGATVVVTAIVTRVARAALREALGEAAPPTADVSA